MNLKRTLFIEETMSNCSFEIAKDPFDSCEMRSPGLLKKLAYMVDGKGYLWSEPSKILYGADEGSVFSDAVGISKESIHASKQGTEYNQITEKSITNTMKIREIAEREKLRREKERDSTMSMVITKVFSGFG